MTFDEYMGRFRGKKVAVLGFGVSNIPLVRLLAKFGAEICVHDKKDAVRLGGAYNEAKSTGVSFYLGEGYLDKLDADVIFRSPGIRPDLPAIENARTRGAELTSEMETFFEVCPCKIIGVTGSDGKTTTTTLIYEILKESGICTHVGGNIGRPLLADVPKMTERDAAVVELSSFQLMTMKKSPDIAVITNISPNHLDIHVSMDEYIAAKRNIFAAQGQSGRLILNMDNTITAGFTGDAAGETYMFSRKAEPERGAFVRGGQIFVRDGSEEPVLDIKDILIPGGHNVENYMAAILAARGFAGNDAVRRVAGRFPGVAHRIEFIRKLRGVAYYNSSIDSSPTRTAAALSSFDHKCVVICGGYDKNIPFEPLGATLVERAKKVVLLGATAEKIKHAIEQTPDYNAENLPVFMAGGLEEAVKTASLQAGEGDTVILSPACASFDMFDNFEQRGDRFREIVNGLQ